MTIPEIQKRLHALADALILPLLFPRTSEEIGQELRSLTFQLSRRPPVTRAPVQSRKMTPELGDKIRADHAAHPLLTQQKIAERWGVTAGRVSEALAGKRK